MTSELAAPIIPSESSSATAERVVLIGFMGAGKSVVGRILAGHLRWDFIDVDTEVERRSGMTIQEIFATQGEAAFRRYESSAIARAMGTRRAVVALGGGAPEELTNRLLLEQTPGTAVVFLQAPFPVLFDRCVLQECGAVRPNLSDPAAAAERFQRRTPHYRRAAQHTVATEGQTPEQTAQAIAALFRSNEMHSESTGCAQTAS